MLAVRPIAIIVGVTAASALTAVFSWQLFSNQESHPPAALSLTLTVILVTVAGLVAAYVCYMRGYGRLNPGSLFVTVWTPLILLYSGLYGPEALLPSVAGLIVLGSVSLCGGVAVTAFLSRPADTATKAKKYDLQRLNRWYWISIVALIASIALQIYRVAPLLGAAGGVTGILTENGLSFRRAYLADRLDSLSNTFNSGGVALGLLGYVLFCGTLAAIWGGFYIKEGRIRRALLPLALLALYSILTLQRASFIYPFLIFCCSWYYHAHGDSDRRAAGRSKLLGLGIVVLVAALVLVIPAYLRGKSSTTIDTQSGLIEYTESGLAGLNSNYLASSGDPTLSAAATGAVSPFPAIEVYEGPPITQGFGIWTFTGVASILKRLGSPIPIPPSQLNYTAVPGPETGVTNTYTYLLYFYYDGGPIGVALLSFLLGVGATAAHIQTLRGAWRWMTLSCILGTTIIMSFFAITPIRDFRYTALCAFAYLLMPRLVRPDPDDDSLPLRNSAVRSST